MIMMGGFGLIIVGMWLLNLGGSLLARSNLATIPTPLPRPCPTSFWNEDAAMSHGAECTLWAISPDGNFRLPQICTYEGLDNACRLEFAGNKSSIHFDWPLRPVTWSADSRYLLVTNGNHDISPSEYEVWDVPNAVRTAHWIVDPFTYLIFPMWSDSGHMLGYAGSPDRAATFVDAATGDITMSNECPDWFILQSLKLLNNPWDGSGIERITDWCLL